MRVHIRHRPHRRQLRRPALTVAGLWLTTYLTHAVLMLVFGESMGERLGAMPERAMWSVAAVVLWSEASKGKRED